MKKFKNGNFRLGEFLVQPEHNKLKKNGEEIKIESKIMQVLCYLVKHKHQVVSRSKIAEDLWPDSVTGLDVVTRAIYELRKVLKDDSKKPTYIETIARKGYCFIYDAVPAERKGNALFDQILLTLNTKRKALVLTPVILILLMVILGLSENKPVDLKATILTDVISYSDMPAISPDEKQLLFVKKTHSKEILSQLVLLDLTSQQQKNITAVNAEYKSPVWLANSDYWFYIRCIKTVACDIVKHNISNEKVETLFSLPQQIISFSISNDESYLVLALFNKNKIELALVDLKVSGSNLKLFGDSAKYSYKSHPVFSHDNKSVYYISTTRDEASQIYRYDLESQKSKKLSKGYDRIRGLALKNKDTLWVSGNKQETNGVWEFDLVNNQSLKVFKAFPGSFSSLLSSQVDGSKLIYTNVSRTINLDAQGIGGLDNLVNVNSSMIDMRAVYSTSLKALYFVSNRNGLYDIWRYKNNAVEKITNIKANMIERPILNLQQNQIAFLSRTNSQTEMTIFDLVNNVELKRILLPKKTFLLSWSNEQESIYYNRFEDGQNNVYKLDVETEKKEITLLNVGGLFQESDDGQSLIFSNSSNKKLMQRVSSGETRVLFNVPEDEKVMMFYAFKVFDDDIYYVSKKEEENSLNYYSLTSRTLNKYMILPDEVYITDIVKGDSVGVIYDKFVKDDSNLIELTR